jgi:hypothetical protein
MEVNSMNRTIAPLTLVVALSASVFACDKPGATEEQREMKANEQSAQARNNQQQTDLNAQAQADKNIAAAQTDFIKTRENYRHAKWLDLADLDKKIMDLQAKDLTATGKTRADLDSALPTIRTRREQFVSDMQAMDSLQGSAWDDAKANLDKEWDGLRSSVDNVR